MKNTKAREEGSSPHLHLFLWVWHPPRGECQTHKRKGGVRGGNTFPSPTFLQNRDVSANRAAGAPGVMLLLLLADGEVLRVEQVLDVRLQRARASSGCRTAAASKRVKAGSAPRCRSRRSSSALVDHAEPGAELRREVVAVPQRDGVVRDEGHVVALRHGRRLVAGDLGILDRPSRPCTLHPSVIWPRPPSSKPWVRWCRRTRIGAGGVGRVGDRDVGAVEAGRRAAVSDEVRAARPTWRRSRSCVNCSGSSVCVVRRQRRELVAGAAAGATL